MVSRDEVRHALGVCASPVSSHRQLSRVVLTGPLQQPRAEVQMHVYESGGL
jgi:hypothetical protein